MICTWELRLCQSIREIKLFTNTSHVERRRLFDSLTSQKEVWFSPCSGPIVVAVSTSALDAKRSALDPLRNNKLLTAPPVAACFGYKVSLCEFPYCLMNKGLQLLYYVASIM